MTNDISALYAQLRDIMNNSSEEEARVFLTDHINEMPEDLRQQIMLALFEDGMNEAAANQAAANEIKEEGAEIMADLQAGKRILDDKLQVIDLQNKMQ